MLLTISSIRMNKNWKYQNVPILVRLALTVLYSCTHHTPTPIKIKPSSWPAPHLVTSRTNSRLQLMHTYCDPLYPFAILESGLEKVLISPWLVTLLHICRVIPTLQSPMLPETPRWYLRLLRAIADVAAPSADVSAPSTDIVASNDRAIADVAAPNADVSTSSADIVALNECSSVLWCFTMF